MQCPQASQRIVAQFSRALRQVFLLDNIQCSKRGSASQWIATKCAPMYTGTDATTFNHTRSQANGSHRDATGQRFRQTEDIGLYLVVLASKEASCASKSRLHFVNDQQSTAFVAESRQASDIFRRSHVDATLALHKLDQDGGSFFSDSLFGSLQVVITDMREARDERRERLTIMRLPGSGERAHAAPVKAAQCCHNALASCSETRELQSAFYRFGTAIAEESTRQALRHQPYQALQQMCTHIVVDSFRAGDQTQGLLRESRRDFCPSMPNVCHPMPGATIDVLASFVIPQQRA